MKKTTTTTKKTKSPSTRKKAAAASAPATSAPAVVSSVKSSNADSKAYFVLIPIAIVILGLFAVLYFFQNNKDSKEQADNTDQTQSEQPVLEETKLPSTILREQIAAAGEINDAYLTIPKLELPLKLDAENMYLYPDNSIYRLLVVSSTTPATGVSISVVDFNKAWYDENSDIYYIGENMITKTAVWDEEKIKEIASSTEQNAWYAQKFTGEEVRRYQEGDLVTSFEEFFQALCDGSETCPEVFATNEISQSGIDGVEIITKPVYLEYGTPSYSSIAYNVFFKDNILYVFQYSISEPEEYDPSEHDLNKYWRDFVSQIELKQPVDTAAETEQTEPSESAE